MLCKPFHLQSSEEVDFDSFCPFSHPFEGGGSFWRPSQLGSFQFGAIMNKAVVDTLVHGFVSIGQRF